MSISWACVGADYREKNMHDVAIEIKKLNAKGDVLSLAFSPDDSELFVATFSETDIQVWAWQDAGHLKRKLHGAQGTGVGTRADGMVFSPDGNLLAVAHDISSDADGLSVIRIFNPHTGATIHNVPETRSGGETSGIGFSRDNKQLIRTFDRSAEYPGDQLMVVNTHTWDLAWSMHLVPLEPTALALSPDDKYVAVGGITLGPGVPNRAQIIIVNLQNRQRSVTIDNAFAPGTGVERMAWSPDGRHLAIGVRVGGSFKGSDAVKIFNPASGEVIANEPAHDALVTALRYTKDGKYLIESGVEGAIRIWDGQHKSLLQTIPAADCYALAVSGDGSYFAAGIGSHIIIWQLK
jgi:WD40 repeat protein